MSDEPVKMTSGGITVHGFFDANGKPLKTDDTGRIVHVFEHSEQLERIAKAQERTAELLAKVAELLLARGLEQDARMTCIQEFLENISTYTKQITVLVYVTFLNVIFGSTMFEVFEEGWEKNTAVVAYLLVQGVVMYWITSAFTRANSAAAYQGMYADLRVEHEKTVKVLANLNDAAQKLLLHTGQTEKADA